MPLHIYFELVSFLASITLFFQKGVPLYMKTFPFFLFMIVVVELIGWKIARGQANIWLYNVFIIIEFEYYLYILGNFIYNRKAKKTILYVILSYPILAIVNIFFGQNNQFNSISYALGCLLVVSASIYYFYELFRLPKSVNLIREHAFWLTSAILFFHCCTFAHFSLMNFILQGSPALFQSLSAIFVVILFLFYLLITIGVLCRIKIRKR